MVDKTILDGQKSKPALDEFDEINLCHSKNRIDETPTEKRNFVHVGMYFISQILLLLLLRKCG